jgi:hypothetical protein
MFRLCQALSQDKSVKLAQQYCQLDAFLLGLCMFEESDGDDMGVLRFVSAASYI